MALLGLLQILYSFYLSQNPNAPEADGLEVSIINNFLSIPERQNAKGFPILV
jgi:hypothetical protein